MNRKLFPVIVVVMVVAIALGAAITMAQSPTGISAEDATASTFTYQGYLTDGNAPANGTYDFQFKLFNAFTGGSQVGSTILIGDVTVTDGLFSVMLDFGANAFGGEPRHLEIGVRPGDSDGTYDVFQSRQTLTGSPFALSAPWSGLTGVPAGFADGVDNDSSTVYTAGNGLTLQGNQFSLAWGTTLSGDGTGFSLISNNASPLFLQGEATGPDLILAGDRGVLSSQPDRDGSELILLSEGILKLESKDRIEFETKNEEDISALADDDFIIILDDDDNSDGDFRILTEAGGSSRFKVDEDGNMTATGTKSAVVTTESYGERKLYAMESPENWFEDFGTAQLDNGKAVVAIDPIFAETVNLQDDYHTFLTPLGDCQLYVAEKTVDSFTVQAMNGESCDISFDYRIVAKRLGYEEVRLEAVENDHEEE